VLFTYNDNVRSAMVMNRGVLIETALINGSWQAVHAILTHCSNLMKREDLLAELMIPLLTSEVYFMKVHKIRYSQSSVSIDHITTRHSWKKCVDVLVNFGLSKRSISTVLQSVGSTAMRKLIKRVLKSSRAEALAARRPRPIEPIQVGPSSPVRFESRQSRRHQDRSPVRTAPFCYVAPPKKYTPTPVPVEETCLEEQHPLVQYWLMRLEEIDFVKQDLQEGLIAARTWPQQAETVATAASARQKKAFRKHDAKTTYSPLGGMAAWAGNQTA